MPLQSRHKRALSIAATAFALSLSVGHAADLPPATLNILGWPRMSAAAFGCYMEKTLGHRDSQFNCGLKNVKEGDPCVDTANYYAGPKFPKALANRIHPLASDVDLSFEHGKLQRVAVTLTGKFDEGAVRTAFGLADQGLPQSVTTASVQDCSLTSTCLLLIGFDHVGAGDVDCSRRPRRSAR